MTIFYLPLALSALTMNLTHFTMSVALNKLPDPDLYISSYNIAKNLALMVQSIGICLTYVVTTFVVNEKTFNKVLKYSIGTILTVAVVILTIGLSPISRMIFSQLYNLTGELLDKAVISFRFIEFFSIAVCIRVFFVGVALKLRYNPLISLSSFLRFFTMLILNFSVGYLINKINIDYIPGLMILLCGLTEMLVISFGILIFNKDLKQNIMIVCKKHNTYNKESNVCYREIFVFAIPIILSFALKNLAPSITNSALALTAQAAKVIAAYSIAMIVTNVISSLVMSYQHIIINHDSFEISNKRIIRRFALFLSGFCCILLFLVGYTSLGDFIFITVLDALPDTAAIAKLVTKFTVFNPLFMLYTAYFNGYLLKIKKTKLLIFERIITIIIPYSLFFLIGLVSWEYAAVMGGVVITLCNLVAGGYNHLVFKYSYNKMLKSNA